MRDGEEKREHKRFIKRCETEFIVDDTQHRGISNNLSMTGIYISTNRPFAPDTLMNLVVYLPNGTSSRIKGQVVRALKSSFGKVMGTPVKSLKSGIGVKLIEKDNNYIEFVNSLLA
ncbi:MAG: PilZ domain-containing protein [Thermodesulfovibrionales bacterium]|nr:PilZ domain-containing protein [Thermodesulfovibrionales bacterium]